MSRKKNFQARLGSFFDIPKLGSARQKAGSGASLVISATCFQACSKYFENNLTLSNSLSREFLYKRLGNSQFYIHLGRPLAVWLCKAAGPIDQSDSFGNTPLSIAEYL